jgi:uncharacterized protein with FMN-binding domain
MEHNERMAKKRNKKRKFSGWKIFLSILLVLGISAGIGWTFLEKEHAEARNLPISVINFSSLRDGTYTGAYAGGMYKWRASEVRATISSGKVVTIELLNNKVDQLQKFTEKLFNRVIEAQSLQVDAISGSTLSSKAYLKSVENALLNAQK